MTTSAPATSPAQRLTPADTVTKAPAGWMECPEPDCAVMWRGERDCWVCGRQGVSSAGPIMPVTSARR